MSWYYFEPSNFCSICCFEEYCQQGSSYIASYKLVHHFLTAKIIRSAPKVMIPTRTHQKVDQSILSSIIIEATSRKKISRYTNRYLICINLIPTVMSKLCKYLESEIERKLLLRHWRVFLKILFQKKKLKLYQLDILTYNT